MVKEFTKKDIFELELEYGVLSKYPTGSPEYWKDLGNNYTLLPEGFISKYEEYFCEYSDTFRLLKEIKDTITKTVKVPKNFLY